MTWKPRYEGEAYPFVIVCPDGVSRHFAHAHREDAESDARLATERSCRFHEKPNRLEEAFGGCPGGVHVVRKKEEI